jgi:hypothetical protein
MGNKSMYLFPERLGELVQDLHPNAAPLSVQRLDLFQVLARSSKLLHG